MLCPFSRTLTLREGPKRGGKFTKMKPILKIFVSENCHGCDEALSVAAKIEQKHSKFLDVEIIDITDARAVVPEAVFATPTFMLNGRIVSLGNPSPKDITQWVAQATTLTLSSDNGNGS